MRGRFIGGILLLVILIVGISALGTIAYQAGLAQASAAAAAGGGTVIVAGAPWGWGFGWGLGFFWILGPILFLFVVFGIARLVFGGVGRRGNHSGWHRPAGPGWPTSSGGPGGPGRTGSWYEAARQVHDEWHREAGSPLGRSDDEPVAPTGTTARTQ